MNVQCSGPNCKRTFDAPEGHEFYFCSVECACYAGHFNVRTGWQTPPKDWGCHAEGAIDVRNIDAMDSISIQSI